MKCFSRGGFRCLFLLVGILVPLAAQSSLTPVLPSPGNEPDLLGAEGILDRYFGLDTLTRIDDSADLFWANEGAISVKTIGKWAGFRQEFGLINADNEFIPLFDVASWGYPRARFGINDSGPRFRFGLDPSGAPLWSSNPGDNPDGLDHMVTWQITGGGNEYLHGAFVIAWEDLEGGGDRDFNDLVLLVKGDVAIAPVPVPAALWLFGSGILCLVTATRQRRTR